MRSSQSSSETRKLATMIAIATIRLKLDSTPPSAMPAWLEALASRASVKVSTGEAPGLSTVAALQRWCA
jgi:hypothetical protein